jgi:hypothetical protein
MRRTMTLGGLAALAVLGWGCASDQKAEPGAAKPSAEAPKPAVAAANASGMIVIEAEHFKANVKAGPIAWVLVTKPAKFSGTGAMQATPNDNVIIETDSLKDSPRLDYEVDFPKAGTWVVWVRGYAESMEDNSCHVGLDGKEVESASRMAEFEPTEEWAWCNTTKDGEVATLKIAAPGKRILNVWMREDGFVIDKILLTQDTKYTPTGNGP